MPLIQTPIIQYRTENGDIGELRRTSLLIKFINGVYDHIYLPTKNYFSKKFKNKEQNNKHQKLLNDIIFIKEVNLDIYLELEYCLNNIDKTSNKEINTKITNLIRKYNNSNYIDDEKINKCIQDICYYLIDYKNNEKGYNFENCSYSY